MAKIKWLILLYWFCGVPVSAFHTLVHREFVLGEGIEFGVGISACREYMYIEDVVME